MQVHFPTPANHQDYELLCLDLWRNRLSDPDAQLVGRLGQAQHGCDIIGRRWAIGPPVGIQAKLLKNSSLTTEVIDAEVNKALSFMPKLSEFVIAYAGPRDAAAQRHTRTLTDRHARVGLFSVAVWSWDDLIQDLREWPAAAVLHYPYLSGKLNWSIARTADGVLDLGFTPNEQIDQRVYEAMQLVEVRALVDDHLLDEAAHVAGELALNAYDHAGSQQFHISVSTTLMTMSWDGPRFDPGVDGRENARGGLSRWDWMTEAFPDLAYAHDHRSGTNFVTLGRGGLPLRQGALDCEIRMNRSGTDIVARHHMHQLIRRIQWHDDCPQLVVWFPSNVMSSAWFMFVRSVEENLPSGRSVLVRSSMDPGLTAALAKYPLAPIEVEADRDRN